MNTAKDIEDAGRILENYPRLKPMITLGVDETTVLSRSAVKSLNRDEFLALCSLPLDIAIPSSIREFFINRAKQYGIKMLFDPDSKLIRIKRIV
jgi:hypothetical protein